MRQKQHKTLQINDLIFLIEPSFQGVNRLFVLILNDNDSRIKHLRYFVPTAIVKYYNVIIDGRIFLVNQLNMI